MLFLVSIPLVTAHYERTDLAGALVVISLMLPVCTFGNPGMWLCIRDVDYGPILKVAVIARTASFVVVIARGAPL